MAATVWKGHLTFGLISIPVKLHRAARAEKVSFRQLYGATSGRVKQVYVREDAEQEDAEENEADEMSPSARMDSPAARPAAFTAGDKTQPSREPVPIRGSAKPLPTTQLPLPPPEPPPPPVVDRSELVKGYEYSKGQFVTVTKQDLEKITPPTATEMQILEFVKLAEVDPIYFETSYWVSPEKAGERAYALLFEALRQSGYVALAQFAMHNREHIVIIRTARKGIVLHTMFYQDEIRLENEYPADTSKVNERELKLALMLVESLAAPFDPTKYHDTYKEKLEALIQDKIEGRETVQPPERKAKAPTDILAALERSLALARKPAATATATTKPSDAAPSKRKKAK